MNGDYEPSLKPIRQRRLISAILVTVYIYYFIFVALYLPEISKHKKLMIVSKAWLLSELLILGIAFSMWVYFCTRVINNPILLTNLRW